MDCPVLNSLAENLTDHDVPEELRIKIMNKSIGTKPFSSEEIEWLLNKNKRISLFYGSDSDAMMSIYEKAEWLRGRENTLYSHISRPANDLQYRLVDEFSLNWKRSKDPNILGILVHSHNHTAMSGQHTSVTEIIENLKDRYGMEIIKNTSVSIPVSIRSNDDERKYPIVNIVIPDLISVYSILKERFSNFKSSNSSELAVRFTRDFLNDLIDSWKSKLYENDILEHGNNGLHLIIYILANLKFLKSPLYDDLFETLFLNKLGRYDYVYINTVDIQKSGKDDKSHMISNILSLLNDSNIYIDSLINLINNLDIN